MPTGGSILYRRLQQRKNQVLRERRQRKPFADGTYIPTAFDIRPGARTFIQDRVQEYGQALIMAPDAADFPLVEITADELEYRIFMIGAAYKMTYGENQAQAFAESNNQQFSTRDVKMSTVVRAIEEKMNDLAAYGDTRLGVTGALNDPAVTLVNSSFDPYDRSANTPEAVAAWFLDSIGGIAVSTNNVEYPTDAVVATELWNELAARQMSQTSETILSFILRTQREASNQNQGGITNIWRSTECRSSNLEAAGAQAAGTNKDRIWLYPRFPDVLEKHALAGVIQSYPEDWAGQGPGFKTYPMYGCQSQMIYNFPGAIRYIDHPKP